MASFMPEQARAPPALPLPVPPVTKARFFDSFFDFHTPVIDFFFFSFFACCVI
jgi:omega-amidase